MILAQYYYNSVYIANFTCIKWVFFFFFDQPSERRPVT